MAAESIDAWIAEQVGWQRELASQLRALVHETVTGCGESIKWGQPTFHFHSDLCYIAAYKHHVNFGFFKGAELTDPAGLLEGTGKGLRHVKLMAGDLAEHEPALRALVEAAAARNQGEEG